MLLGYKDGFPIFTFTANPEHNEFNRPSIGYLNQIITGLKECYALGDENIADYLIKKNGIRTSYTRNELLSLIQTGDKPNKDDK